MVRYNTHRVLVTILCILMIAGCSTDKSSNKKQQRQVKPPLTTHNPFELDTIRKRGYITAIVDNSASSMFLYRGEPMGFEYELISMFAKSMGLKLKFRITQSIMDGFELLNAGEGDILAHNLTITKERRKIIDFTDSHYTVRQMLVQRKPSNWRKMKLHEIEKLLIRDPIQLAGKEIHVRKSSSYVSRLEHLSEEIGEDLVIIEEEDLETEAILELVADGTFDYAVADENVAKVMSRFHPNLDANTAVSFPQQIAWGLRHSSDSLKMAINSWLATVKGTASYNELYNKYFKNSLKVREILASDFYSTSGQKISPYDSMIKVGAEKIGWDWRLLAAQISRESRFDPQARSWVGAVGLMQLMPRTAKEYGVHDLRDPIRNIKAGVRHIQWLQGRWLHIEDSAEQTKFVLASYNVGDGHVRDAMRLAQKHGEDHLQWANVAKYLKLKSKRKYFEDEVVQFGYCRGQEPVEYVQDILFRYNKYLELGAAEG